MCHNAPWLSALDKQIWLQFAPKKSKASVLICVVRYCMQKPAQPASPELVLNNWFLMITVYAQCDRPKSVIQD